MAEPFYNVIDKIIYDVDFSLVCIVVLHDVNLTMEDRNTNFDQLDNWLDVHLILYGSITTKAITSLNFQSTYCAFMFRIFNKSYW